MKSKENHSRKKLNIVDYCVIVLLVAVLALVGWKKFGGNSAESTASGAVFRMGGQRYENVR